MAMKVWMFLLAMTLPDISSKIVNDSVSIDSGETPTIGTLSNNVPIVDSEMML